MLNPSIVAAKITAKKYSPRTLSELSATSFCAAVIFVRSIIPKTKKFGCVSRGDLTFLFKSCEIDKSQGRLV